MAQWTLRHMAKGILFAFYHPMGTWEFKSFVSPGATLKHPNVLLSVCSNIQPLYIYMFAGLCAFLADVASQAGDADSSRAPGLTSGSWTEPGVLACILQFTVISKNPAKCLLRWEPDRIYNFFGPSAHVCRHMCDLIFFQVLHYPLVSSHFDYPLVPPCLGLFSLFVNCFNRPFCYGISTRKKKTDCSSCFISRSEVFLECPAFCCAFILSYSCWHSYNRCSVSDKSPI